MKNNTVILVGEISSSAEIDTEKVVRQAIRNIGYTKEELGFNADTAEIISRLDRQSPDIAQGVDRALETRETQEEAELAAGLAKKAEIQLAYAIGVASPVSVNINTFGTGTVSDETLQDAISALVDLRPGAIIQNLNLCRPIYSQTAAYGHFGRTDLDLPWEKDRSCK